MKQLFNKSWFKGILIGLMGFMVFTIFAPDIPMWIRGISIVTLFTIPTIYGINKYRHTGTYKN